MRVESGDVSLAVYEHGDPANPTVLLIHGYPDDHAMWDGVVDALISRYHVVTYDVRGAGDSSHPRAVSQYRLEHLANDFFAVADAVSPAKPVHVVAHDWGSIQGWEAVTDPRAPARVASYTTISGPSLDHIGMWIRRRMAKPSPRHVGQLLNQQLHSWYILFFHTPVVSELVWRLGAGKVVARIEGLKHAPRVKNAVHGMKLYRANIFQRVRAPRERSTDVPVQVIAPTGDRYVTPALLEDLHLWASRLWRRKVIGRHWVATAKPGVIARMVDEFVSHVSGSPATHALERAKSGRSLVVITGAGSGIGRATAQEFAAQGDFVIATDIDLATARETADQIGGVAYQLDVADEAAVNDLANRIAAEHGVPDVVVNNAGIAVAGPFMDTSTKDWQRVLDVNLLGVIHGCQAFGRLMIDAAEGGHIVNISSAAAYTPTRSLPAYASSKAAVLMLSECLRAELAPQGIGVSAICPGIVNTPITRATTFVSGNQEQLRERTARAYQRRNFPASGVAREIVAAVRSNRAVVPVTIEAKAGLWGSRLTPGVMRRLARIGVGQ
ncbi:SDR family oxidoreductase [Actinocrispum wychmicini]|uniref:NADP-dependent 3-hydroxy acid dehydrogenase YdfG n=1 Tax=Actinocrispum wychmicini TaxID=1213861 RepID=A0A4R2JFF9_9PSEU|nr:SDR family oxidoreductase [Actinocrispum wychmicini]TCO58473.1 NADP-dependent 3-hydroxy acid dehydrogenase YdfG [Actinocrispum wychmicini]